MSPYKVLLCKKCYHTMVAKNFVTSLLLPNYAAITCILADAYTLISDARSS